MAVNIQQSLSEGPRIVRVGVNNLISLDLRAEWLSCARDRNSEQECQKKMPEPKHAWSA
jgi:hypothetical protein